MRLSSNFRLCMFSYWFGSADVPCGFRSLIIALEDQTIVRHSSRGSGYPSMNLWHGLSALTRERVGTHLGVIRWEIGAVL